MYSFSQHFKHFIRTIYFLLTHIDTSGLFLKIINFFFNSIVVWKVWRFFQNILHSFGVLVHKKLRNSKNLPPKKLFCHST